jgi:hypothetical protein
LATTGEPPALEIEPMISAPGIPLDPYIAAGISGLPMCGTALIRFVISSREYGRFREIGSSPPAGIPASEVAGGVTGTAPVSTGVVGANVGAVFVGSAGREEEASTVG